MITSYEPMTDRAGIHTHLMHLLVQWVPIQTQTNQRHYLYYRPSTTDVPGDLILLGDSEAIPAGYELVHAESLRLGLSPRGNLKWLDRLGIVDYLPILDITGHKPITEAPHIATT